MSTYRCLQTNCYCAIESDGPIPCGISTCDSGHFVGEVALLQILKMSSEPLPPRRQRAVVPGLSFELEKNVCSHVTAKHLHLLCPNVFIVLLRVCVFAVKVHSITTQLEYMYYFYFLRTMEHLLIFLWKQNHAMHPYYKNVLMRSMQTNQITNQFKSQKIMKITDVNIEEMANTQGVSVSRSYRSCSAKTWRLDVVCRLHHTAAATRRANNTHTETVSVDRSRNILTIRTCFAIKKVVPSDFTQLCAWVLLYARTCYQSHRQNMNQCGPSVFLSQRLNVIVRDDDGLIDCTSYLDITIEAVGCTWVLVREPQH